MVGCVALRLSDRFILFLFSDFISTVLIANFEHRLQIKLNPIVLIVHSFLLYGKRGFFLFDRERGAGRVAH